MLLWPDIKLYDLRGKRNTFSIKNWVSSKSYGYVSRYITLPPLKKKNRERQGSNHHKKYLLLSRATKRCLMSPSLPALDKYGTKKIKVKLCGGWQSVIINPYKINMDSLKITKKILPKLECKSTEKFHR